MIQISAKNPLFLDTLLSVLQEFHPVVYQPADIPAPLLLLCESQKRTDEILSSPAAGSVVLLGTHHEKAELEVPLPCSAVELISHIRRLLSKLENAPDFENSVFLFEGAKRLLTLKPLKKEIRLTEKETEMIICLIKALPDSVTKTDLLTKVWNYRPGSETHTVETHIYTLRQKIGDKYTDMFITNTPDGYMLVQSKTK